MQGQLKIIHHQVSALLKIRLPEPVMTIDSLTHLLKIYGQKLLELDKVHNQYKTQSEQYMQFFLEEIRVRTRLLEDKSKYEDISQHYDKEDLHRISYDDASQSRAVLNWDDVIQVLDQAFSSSQSVKKGCQLLQTLNYQINYEKLKSHKMSIQLIEWLQQANRFKDQQIRNLYDFITTDKQKMQNTFPTLVLLVKNQFLTLCQTQKGYIRSIQELNHQVKQLISQITTRQVNNYDQKQKIYQNDSQRDISEQLQPTTKQIQFVMNDYQRLKTQTHRLKQLLKNNSSDFLPIQRQLARHINISNILQTQINRVIRQFNIYEDSFWEIYELPQVESLEHILQHLMNINQRMQHMTGKVNRIFKCHVDIKRNKNQLKIGCIMQEIEQLLKTKQPQIKEIQHICSEVKNLTDGLLKDDGLGKGLLRIILGLDNLFSLLPIKDADILSMIEQQKQRLLRLVGGLSGKSQKSEDKSTIMTQYQRQIIELKKQNQWFASREQKLQQQNQSLRQALQQFKQLNLGTQNHLMIYSLQNKVKQLTQEKQTLEEQLKEQKVRCERQKNNLHLQVKKTSVKLQRLEKLALRKMDINVEKHPINMKKGKVNINSHL